MSSFYEKAKESLLRGDFNFESGNIKAILIAGGQYTPDFSLNEFYSDIPVSANLSEVALANKTIAGGVFDSDDLVFPAVSSGTATAVCLFDDDGGANGGKLIAFIDDGQGLPITANGSDISVSISDTNGIFNL